MSDQNDAFDLDGEEEAPEQEQHQGPQVSDSDADYASPERFNEDRVRLVDFLQYPREKRKLTEFLEETYKAYEQESVDRTINRIIHEHDNGLRGATPFHKPGHIGPLMYQYLNMMGVEAAFVSGLQHTKSSMVKTVNQKVDEINTLLRGVGGFNRQIKASFSRSAVVYLEQEDPFNAHRENVVFTVNLADFELRYRLDENAADAVSPDGRTMRRLVWDEAVNTLAEIVSNTGLKPKYVKNDKNTCRFTMRQHLLSPDEKQPDEYFVFDLVYVNEETREGMAQEYMEKVQWYVKEIADCEKALKNVFLGRKKREDLKLRLKHLRAEEGGFIGTHPDPNEMDYGIMFSIKINTMKDYTITKDKMQVIMTKYILALSKIAVDKSMDQQVSAVYTRQGKGQDFQNLDVSASDQSGPYAGSQGAGGPPRGKKVVVMKKDDLQAKKKKAAGGGFKL